MKFSGKICFKVILKVTKNQGFTLSLEDTNYEKKRAGGGGGVKLPPSRCRVNEFSWNKMGETTNQLK